MRETEKGEEKRHAALHSEKVMGDRKVFFLDLKQNERGRFIKITEEVRGHRDTIMLPIENALDFLEALQNLMEIEAEMD